MPNFLCSPSHFWWLFSTHCPVKSYAESYSFNTKKLDGPVARVGRGGRGLVGLQSLEHAVDAVHADHPGQVERAVPGVRRRLALDGLEVVRLRPERARGVRRGAREQMRLIDIRAVDLAHARLFDRGAALVLADVQHVVELLQLEKTGVRGGWNDDEPRAWRGLVPQQRAALDQVVVGQLGAGRAARVGGRRE